MTSPALSSPSASKSPYPRRRLAPALLATAALLGSAGCADLPPIDADVCGNHVVDGDEDCDEDSTRCHPPGQSQQCRYACDLGDDEVDELPCPAGYGCGIDKVCRQSVGRFDYVGIGDTSNTSELGTAHLDGDGRIDLLRATRDVTTTNFFGADFNTEESGSINRRPWGPPPMLGDLDDDGNDDIVFGIEIDKESGSTGLAVYRSADDRTLESQTYISLPLEATFARGLRLDILGWNEDIVVGFAETNGNTGIVGLSGGRKVDTLPLPPELGPLFATKSAKDIVGVAKGHFFNGPASRCEDVAFTVEQNTGAKVWVLEVCSRDDSDPNAPALVWNDPPVVHEIDLPAGARVGAPKWHDLAPGAYSVLHTADVNGDGIDDLVVVAELAGGNNSVVGVTYGRPAGEFSSDPMDLTGPPDNAFVGLFASNGPCDGWTTLLTTGDLNGDGFDDLVFDRGALLFRPGIGYQQVECQARWGRAVIDDFDRNGVGDIIATRRPGVEAGGVEEAFALASGLDVFFGTPDGAFTRSLISTDDPVLWLVSGDVDGDSVADVVYSEALIDPEQGLAAGREPDQLWAAFGSTSGGMEEPIAIGSLANVQQLVAGRFVAGDAASDVLVLAQGADSLGLAVVAGVSSRQLVSPFTLTTAADGPVLTVTALASGYLVDSALEPDGSDGSPPAVHGAFSVLTADPWAGTYRLWLIQQVGDEMELREKELVWPTSGDYLCYSCLMVAADLDPEPDTAEPLDEILVIGEQDLPDGTSTELTVLEVSGANLDRVLHPRATKLDFDDFDVLLGEDGASTVPPIVRDLDDDGAVEVLFHALGSDGTTEGLAVLWNDETGSFEQTGFIADAKARVLAFAVLNVDGDPELELAVALEEPDAKYGDALGNVVILDLDAESRSYTPLLEGKRVQAWWDEDESDMVYGELLAAGDFDGDGVDDLVVGNPFSYDLFQGEAAKR